MCWEKRVTLRCSRLEPGQLSGPSKSPSRGVKMTRTTLNNPDRSRRAAFMWTRRHGTILTLFVLAAAFSGLPLSLAGSPDESEVDLRKRLNDAKPAVRLQAALELVKKGNAEAVPVLIDLLAEVSPAHRQPIEEALRGLAGAWAPNV